MVRISWLQKKKPVGAYATNRLLLDRNVFEEIIQLLNIIGPIQAFLMKQGSGPGGTCCQPPLSW